MRTSCRTFTIAALGALTLTATAGIGSAQAATTASIGGTILRVVGDADANDVALRLSGTTIQVDVGDDGTAEFSTPQASVQGFSVRLGEGADDFRVDTSGGDPTNEFPVSVDMGAGNDIADTANGFDQLDGGSGDDRLSPGQRFDQVVGGDGVDTITWVPGDASDVIDGGAGSDLLDFDGSNASEIITLNRQGDRTILNRDVAAVDQDTVRVERLDLSMLGGSDNFTAAENTGDLMALTVDAGTSTTGQQDTVTGGSANDVLRGGAGNDAINGGGGDDDLFGDADTDSLDGGDGADVCDGETEANCEFDVRPAPVTPPAPEPDPIPEADTQTPPADDPPAAPRDTTAPRGALDLGETAKFRKVLRRGLEIGFSCDEACGADAVLEAGRQTLGRGDASLDDDGDGTIDVDLTRTGKRKVEQAADSKKGRLRATVEVTLTDPSGNARTLDSRLTLGR